MLLPENQTPEPAITGIGLALGERPVSNDELIETTGIHSSDAAIRRLMGIEQRYFAAEGTLASDLAYSATQEAMKMAGLTGGDISSINLSTTTPDYPGSYTATRLHRLIGGPLLCRTELTPAACTGAIYALSSASREIICNPRANAALAVASELMSRILNYDDRTSAPIFGDGAGAAPVQHVPGAKRPVFSFATREDREALYVPEGGVANPGTGGPDSPGRKIHWIGKRVGEHAKHLMPLVLYDALEQDGAVDSKTGEVDWDRYAAFTFHQANVVLLRGMAKALGIPEEKLMITGDKYGNMSSASVFSAIHEAESRGLLQDGGRILSTSVAAGFTAAAMAIDVRIGARPSQPTAS